MKKKLITAGIIAGMTAFAPTCELKDLLLTDRPSSNQKRGKFKRRTKSNKK